VRIATVLQSKGALRDVVATIGPDATVADVVAELVRHRIGALVVSPDGVRIDGIVSERDVVRALAERGAGALTTTVREVMTAPVHVCRRDDEVEAVMAAMTEHRVRHVPVVDADRLVGLVSIGDVVKSRLGDLENERSALVEYITAGR
jgi:CBS domain-containing protein